MRPVYPDLNISQYTAHVNNTFNPTDMCNTMYLIQNIKIN